MGVGKFSVGAFVFFMHLRKIRGGFVERAFGKAQGRVEFLHAEKRRANVLGNDRHCANRNAGD